MCFSSHIYFHLGGLDKDKDKALSDCSAVAKASTVTHYLNHYHSRLACFGCTKISPLYFLMVDNINSSNTK